jgi:hypothetical protein
MVSDLMNRRPSPSRRRNDRVVTTAVVVLGALVVACLGMLVPPMWAAVVDAWQYHPEARQCRPLDGTKARQLCNQRVLSAGSD